MSNMNLGAPVVINGYTSPATTAYGGNYLIYNQRGQATYARRITFNNMDATNKLKVYINGSVAYLTIPPNGSYTVEGNVTSYGVQASASTVAWNAVANVA